MRDKISSFLIGHKKHDSFWGLRILLIRGLGLIYLVVFSILLNQGLGLWGRQGLLPITNFVELVEQHFGGKASAFFDLPSLFYFIGFDQVFNLMAIAGILLSLLMLAGFANLIILFILWSFQLSLVNSGQLFYGYGWETQVLEFTFLAFFLVPLWNPNLKNSKVVAPRIVIWAMRWQVFRLMLGAGLIKLRGDECWRDLTCLVFHYETQPIPNPLSYFYHQMPGWFHMGEVLFNHFVEMILPFGIFGPKWVRRITGIFFVLFQIILILSGNLAWLNWLTLVMCLSCFDDEFLEMIFRGKIQTQEKSGRPRIFLLAGFSILICFLSYEPVLNLLSPQQAMNTSYNQWHLLNSYGAFGSVGRERPEIIIEGTRDSQITETSDWKAYEFHCAPGDVSRRPCWISPYHYHLDWQIWFSGMRPKLEEEWLLRLAVRLLENDKVINEMFEKTPFADGPPKHIRIRLFKYQFADWKDWPATWWKREFINEYMPPISLNTPEIKNYLK